jgi:dTDP-4-amino-4,6-dideoxygalactose transaminase
MKNNNKVALITGQDGSYLAEFFKVTDYTFIKETVECKSNYWLNSIILKNKQQRDEFLNETNSQNVMTRPIWTLMSKLPMFESAQCGDLTNSEWLEECTVNIPSSVIIDVTHE